MRKFVTKMLFILLVTDVINAQSFNVNSDNFLNILKQAQDGDVLNVTDNISVTNGYHTDYESVSMRGVTIEGNNYKVHILGRPLSMKGDVVFKNVKLSMLLPNSLNPPEEAEKLEKTAVIYANGYNLTFDNVITDVDNHPNTFPTIIMGNEKAGQGSNRDNKFEVKNQTSELKLKTVIAGSKEGTKQGKSTIILTDKVNIKSSGGTVILRNLNDDTSLDVELKNESKNVRTFDAGDNPNVKITIENVKYDVGAFESEFKGKIKEITLKNDAALYTDDKLEVENIILVSDNGKSPKISVFAGEGDPDTGVEDKKGEIKVTRIDSTAAPNAIISLGGTSKASVETVVGNFHVEGDRNKFNGYTRDNPSTTSPTPSSEPPKEKEPGDEPALPPNPPVDSNNGTTSGDSTGKDDTSSEPDGTSNDGSSAQPSEPSSPSVNPTEPTSGDTNGGDSTDGMGSDSSDDSGENTGSPTDTSTSSSAGGDSGSSPSSDGDTSVGGDSSTDVVQPNGTDVGSENSTGEDTEPKTDTPSGRNDSETTGGETGKADEDSGSTGDTAVTNGDGDPSNQPSTSVEKDPKDDNLSSDSNGETTGTENGKDTDSEEQPATDASPSEDTKPDNGDQANPNEAVDGSQGGSEEKPKENDNVSGGGTIDNPATGNTDSGESSEPDSSDKPSVTDGNTASTTPSGEQPTVTDNTAGTSDTSVDKPDEEPAVQPPAPAEERPNTGAENTSTGETSGENESETPSSSTPQPDEVNSTGETSTNGETATTDPVVTPPEAPRDEQPTVDGTDKEDSVGNGSPSTDSDKEDTQPEADKDTAVVGTGEDASNVVNNGNSNEAPAETGSSSNVGTDTSTPSAESTTTSPNTGATPPEATSTDEGATTESTAEVSNTTDTAEKDTDNKQNEDDKQDSPSTDSDKVEEDEKDSNGEASAENVLLKEEKKELPHTRTVLNGNSSRVLSSVMNENYYILENNLRDGVWVSTSANVGRLGRDYKVENSGIFVGYNKEVNSNNYAIGFSYNNLGMKDKKDKLNSEMYTTYAHTDFKLDNSIFGITTSLGINKSKLKDDTLFGNKLMYGYEFNFKNIKIVPMVELRHLMVKEKSYELPEMKAKVDAKTVNYFNNMIGTKLSYTKDNLKLFTQIGVDINLKNKSEVRTLTVDGAPHINVNEKLDRVTNEFVLGAEYEMVKNLVLGLQYKGRYNSKKSSNDLKFFIKYTF